MRERNARSGAATRQIPAPRHPATAALCLGRHIDCSTTSVTDRAVEKPVRGPHEHAVIVFEASKGVTSFAHGTDALRQWSRDRREWLAALTAAHGGPSSCGALEPRRKGSGTSD